jgi:GDP-L-fucose synthase
MKKILVTGASGFIGRNIAESYLNEKYELHIPKRAELDCSDDGSVANYFARHSFDVVIHSAAKPGHRNAADTTSLLLTNSRMIFNMLKHQDKWGKFLNMGSGAIYDMRHYEPKMKESYFGTYIPADEHGYNKYILGKFLPHLDHVYDFRIFGIFGKYEDYAIRFISNAICKAIHDLPITLRQSRKFDYLYIDNLMPILEHFIEHGPIEKSFNITPDNSIELLEIAKIVRQVSGKPIEIKVVQEGLGMEYSGDNSLLRAEYPGVNFTPIEKSVEQLYAWYVANKTSIDRNLLITDK